MVWFKKGIRLGTKKYGLTLIDPASHAEVKRDQGYALNKKKEQNEDKRIQKQYKREENLARHRGHLVYLEKEAAKGTAKDSGIKGFLSSGITNVLSNAASNTSSGQSMFSPIGGGYGGRRRGGQASWDPITGLSYGGSRKTHHRVKHRKQSRGGKSITIRVG